MVGKLTDPTPTPTLTTAPLTVGNVSVPGMSIVNPGGTTSTADKSAFKGFGFTVDLTGLFAGSGVTTGDTALALFQQAARDTSSSGAGSNVGQYVAIQDAMLKGGFYGQAMPSFGQIGPDDITAFQKFLVFAGQSYDAAVTNGLIKDQDRAPADLSAVGLLNSQASAGVEFGISAAARRRSAQLNIIRHVNPDDTAAALADAYKQALGRDPTDAERNAFQAAYDAQVVGPQEAAARAQARTDEANAAASGYGAGPGLPGGGHVNAQPPAIPGPWASGYITQEDAGMIAGPWQSGYVTQQQAQDNQGPSNDDLTTFMNAISGQESGGNYNAVNADSGASGKFQIMPSNWPSWSREAGLGPNAPRTPENQDKVARYKMQSYYNSYHNWGAVAAAWYGGPSAGAAYLKDPGAQWLQRRQGGGKYPSIAGYAASVLGRFGRNPVGARTDYDAQAVGGGGSDLSLQTGATSLSAAPGSDLHVTDAPSLSSAADANARKAHPVEYGAHKVASTFDSFLQLISGIA